MTTVSCVKVLYINPLGYNNAKEWVADPKNIWTGRDTRVPIYKKDENGGKILTEIWRFTPSIGAIHIVNQVIIYRYKNLLNYT